MDTLRSTFQWCQKDNSTPSYLVSRISVKKSSWILWNKLWFSLLSHHNTGFGGYISVFITENLYYLFWMHVTLLTQFLWEKKKWEFNFPSPEFMWFHSIAECKIAGQEKRQRVLNWPGLINRMPPSGRFANVHFLTVHLGKIYKQREARKIKNKTAEAVLCLGLTPTSSFLHSFKIRKEETHTPHDPNFYLFPF